MAIAHRFLFPAIFAPLLLSGCVGFAASTDPQRSCEDDGWDKSITVSDPFVTRAETVRVTVTVRNCGERDSRFDAAVDGCNILVMIAGGLSDSRGDHTVVPVAAEDCDSGRGPERHVRAGESATWSSTIEASSLTAGTWPHVPPEDRDGTQWLVLAGPEYSRTPAERGSGFTHVPLTSGTPIYIYTSSEPGSRVPIRLALLTAPSPEMPGYTIASDAQSYVAARSGKWSAALGGREPAPGSPSPEFSIERAVIVAIPSPCGGEEPPNVRGEPLVALQPGGLRIGWDPPFDSRPSCRYRASLVSVFFVPGDVEVAEVTLPEIQRTDEYSLVLRPNETFTDIERGSGVEGDPWGVEPWRGKPADSYTLLNAAGSPIAACESASAPDFGSSPTQVNGAGCEAGTADLAGKITLPLYQAGLYIHCYGPEPCDLRVKYAV